MAVTQKMPYNLEAEQSVLGCILIDQVIQIDIVSELSERDFLVESHKIIFRAMNAIIAENGVIDLVTISDYLGKNAQLENVGGIAYLTELTQMIPSSANYSRYVDIIKRDSVLRRLITSSNLIIEDAYTSVDSQASLQRAEKLIYDISEKTEKNALEQISVYLDPVLDKFEKLEKNVNFNTGLKSGIKRLDYATNGFQRGNLIIIAARPSVGKTTFAMNIVEEVALKQDAVVAVFELEMTKLELAQRMLCANAGVRMDDALKGKLTERDPSSLKKLWEAQKRLNNAKIFIDETSIITPQNILTKCRRLKAMQGGKLDLVVVDHIQLMSSARKDNDNRQQEVTDISKNLKALAKELDVPVIALSQLSRGITSRKGNNTEPVLSDLRESGAIEQDADLVIFLHREDMVGSVKEGQSDRESLTKILVSKNRNGKLDRFDVIFRGEYGKFYNFYVTNPDGAPSVPKTKEDFEQEESDRKYQEALSKIDLDEDEINSLSNNIPPEDDNPF